MSKNYVRPNPPPRPAPVLNGNQKKKKWHTLSKYMDNTCEQHLKAQDNEIDSMSESGYEHYETSTGIFPGTVVLRFRKLADET